MNLNGAKINISLYTFESLNDEMVIYNEDSKKIIVLNQTAMIVWEEIINNYSKNIDITTKDIANIIIDIYSLEKTDMDIICIDVDKTIDLLFQSSLINKNLHWEVREVNEELELPNCPNMHIFNIYINI